MIRCRCGTALLALDWEARRCADCQAAAAVRVARRVRIRYYAKVKRRIPILADNGHEIISPSRRPKRPKRPYRKPPA